MENITLNLFNNWFPEDLINKIIVEAFYDKDSVKRSLEHQSGNDCPSYVNLPFLYENNNYRSPEKTFFKQLYALCTVCSAWCKKIYQNTDYYRPLINKMPDMHFACCVNDLPLFIDLKIKAKKQLYEKDQHGCFPIHYASSDMKYIIKCGETAIGTDEQITLERIKNKYTKELQEKIDRFVAVVLLENGIHAILGEQLGYSEIVLQLIKSLYFNKDCNINAYGLDQKTFLHYMCLRRCNIDSIEKMLQYPEVQCYMLEKNNALPVLKMCIEVNYPYAFARICAIQGFNLNAIFPDVMVEFVKLTTGFELNDTWKSHLSAQNVNYQDSITGKTPLMYAVEKGNIKLIEWFLSYEVLDFNIKDNSGDTVLDIVDRNNQKQVQSISLDEINHTFIFSLVLEASKKKRI